MRVVQGKKGPNDLRLDVLVNGGWRSVSMHLAFMLTDFFYENENALYPYPARGGPYFMDALKTASRYGHERAQKELEFDQRRKQMRLLDSVVRPTTEPPFDDNIPF